MGAPEEQVSSHLLAVRPGSSKGCLSGGFGLAELTGVSSTDHWLWLRDRD